MAIADQTGQQIGKYRVLRRLGSSRFADVYLCRGERQKQQRVLKLFHVYLFPDERRAFEEDAQALASLSHPNIVPVLDYGVLEGENAPWIVMSYISGTTLRERYLPGMRVPLSEIIVCVQQLAAALQYAHDHGVVHQNIKPENIFVGRDGKLLLSDFALPVVLLHPAVEHEGALTIAAMPPEQAEGRAAPASDQYALAALAYEWLTGERWRAEDGADTVQRDGVLRQKVPALSPLIKDVLGIALRPDPELRFRSIKAFATALTQAYEESQGVEAGSVVPVTGMNRVLARMAMTERESRTLWRSLLLLVTCMIVLLGLGGGIFVYFVSYRSHQVTPPVTTVKTHTARPTPGPTATVVPTAPLAATTTPVAAGGSPTTAAPTATPTATATPTPGPGTVLYQADWSQGWSGAGSADWSVANNELVSNGSSRDPGAAPTILAPYTANRADYAVEIYARANALYPCFDAGTLRGFRDASGWHGYKAAVCDQKIRLQAGNNDSIIASTSFQPGNQWHRYRFEVQGSQLSFFVDGKLLVQANDTQYTSGGEVGLKSYETYLEVSDFKIIAL